MRRLNLRVWTCASGDLAACCQWTLVLRRWWRCLPMLVRLFCLLDARRLDICSRQHRTSSWSRVRWSWWRRCVRRCGSVKAVFVEGRWCVERA
jgi:hypothetical protein